MASAEETIKKSKNVKAGETFTSGGKTYTKLKTGFVKGKHDVTSKAGKTRSYVKQHGYYDVGGKVISAAPTEAEREAGLTSQQVAQREAEIRADERTFQSREQLRRTGFDIRGRIEEIRRRQQAARVKPKGEQIQEQLEERKREFIANVGAADEGAEPQPQPRGFAPRIEARQPFPRKNITTYEEYQKREERIKAPIRAKIYQPAEKAIEKASAYTPKLKSFKPAADVAIGVGSGLVGISKAALHPVKTAKGISYAIKKPREVGWAFKEHLHKKGLPHVVGEIYGYKLGGKIIGKGLAKAPKPKYVSFKVPLKTKEATLYRGLSVEMGTKAKVVAGFKGKRLTLGTPRVDLSKAKAPFIVETASQREILLRSLPAHVKTAAEAKKLVYAKGIMGKTYKTPSRFVTKKWIHETKALKPRGVKQVLKFAKREEADLYGSYPARQQLLPKYRRTPADIDVQLFTSEKLAIQKTKFLASQLKKVGEKVRVSKTAPTLIEVQRKGAWHHAVDIHSLEAGAKDVLSPAYAKKSIYGFPLSQKSIKIQKIRAMPLSEQGIRKGGSIFTVNPSKEGLVLKPAAHRIKDIPDFFAAQETLLKSRLVPSVKGTMALKKLKALYPKELLPKSVKVHLYSPKLKAPSPSFPITSISQKGIFAKSPSPYRIASPKKSPSPYPYKAPSLSPSYYYPKIIASPSISPSPSRSRSPSYASPSYPSPPSYPPSYPPSKSPSPSPSPSPSISISPSPYPSPSLTPAPRIYPPLTSFAQEDFRIKQPAKEKKKKKTKRKYRYVPQFWAVAGKVKAKKTPALIKISKTGTALRPILF